MMPKQSISYEIQIKMRRIEKSKINRTRPAIFSFAQEKNRPNHLLSEIRKKINKMDPKKIAQNILN